jgi:hypothetical protein
VRRCSNRLGSTGNFQGRWSCDPRVEEGLGGGRFGPMGKGRKITAFLRGAQIVVTGQTPQGPTIVGTGNGTPEVPELPSAWGYSWATLSPGFIYTER